MTSGNDSGSNGVGCAHSSDRELQCEASFLNPSIHLLQTRRQLRSHNYAAKQFHILRSDLKDMKRGDGYVHTPAGVLSRQDGACNNVGLSSSNRPETSSDEGMIPAVMVSFGEDVSHPVGDRRRAATLW